MGSNLERRGPAGWAVHPGEVLKQEFMIPLDLSGYALAKAIAVPAQAISDIILQKRGISADMATRLARYFDTTDEFWMNLQAASELASARKANRRALKKIRPHAA
jgi:addiction module HigA family antidote